MIEVSVEFYGIPRRRAGVSRGVARGSTVREALSDLRAAYPGLAGGVIEADGRVGDSFRVCLNAGEFLDLRGGDGGRRLVAGDVLILLSADVGG